MEPSSKPNIIYILADDMGYGDLSCLNPNSKIRTPHLDRLCREGMAFTDGHATSAVCTPSRYSILTGRYNWRSELKQGVIDAYGLPVIEPGRATVASFLRKHGYSTACIGKWHLGWQWGRSSENKDEIDYSQPIMQGPIDYGFDYFYGIPASLDMPPYVYLRNDRVVEAPTEFTPGRRGKEFWREGPIAPGFRHAEVLSRLTEEAEEYISAQSRSEAPFFLYFSLTGPHTPILPSSKFQNRSGTNAYGDFCLEIDSIVGSMMDILERHNISQNTILIFTSDNGCSPTANFEELAECGHRPSHIFRGHKADIYEGGHRVPLLVRWPKVIGPGSQCSQTVCLVDLFATCADLLKAPMASDEGEDSVSSLPLWRGEPVSPALREATVHHSFDGSFSIRLGSWKLEMCPGSGGWSYPKPGEEPLGMPPVQLYNLEEDIAEQNNVYQQYPEVVTHLRNLLTQYVTTGRSTPGRPQHNTGVPHWQQLWWINSNLRMTDE